MRSHRFDRPEPEVEEPEDSPPRYPGKVTMTAGFRPRAERDVDEDTAHQEQNHSKSASHGAARLAALDDPFGLHVPIQAKGDLRGAKTADPHALPSTSSGAPLPPAVRAVMERAFNADFGDVLIHPDSARAAAIGARAYTEGNSVHMAPGQYDPESRAGRELIGHELAHVIQQRQGRVAATSQVRGIAINDAPGLEQEADTLGQRAASIAVTSPAVTPAPSVERAASATPSPVAQAVAQRQAAPQSNEETLDGEVEAAAQLEHSSDPAERAYGTRLLLLLTLMRPENVDDDAVLFPFIDKCQEFARDEKLTLGFLAFKRDRNTILEEDGGGFPVTWAERIAQELRIDANLKELEAAYQAERASALAGVGAIGATVWARGLPLTLDQARHLDADGLVRDVLTYRRLAAGSSEPTDRYAAAMASWLRVAAHYGALLEHERDLADQVRQIRAGELVVTRPYYKQQRAKLDELKAALQFVHRAGADPATVARKFFRVLSWTVAESLESFGGAGGATTWPHDGVEAYRTELAKLDARLASATSADSITRALTWANERGYLSAAGREVWNAIKADAVKMIATAVGILILQQIPGVNVALDVVLVIEFGLDAVTTLGEVVDTLKAAIRAKSVVDMEHAAAMMASTIVGDAAKLLLWAATWGIAKASKRIKSYRDGKKFLDEHGNSSEARAALAGAKGDIAKAKATLAKKRAQEQRARDQKELDEQSSPSAPRPDEPPPPAKDTPPATPKVETPEEWLARVAEGLTPEEKVKFEKMAKGKTAEELRRSLGGDGNDVEVARAKVRKAVGEERDAVVLRARSQERMAELKQKIADLDLMNDPEVRAILEGPGALKDRLPKLRDKVMAKVLKAEAQAAHPTGEVLESVKIYEKQAEKSIEEWRNNHPKPDGSPPSIRGLVTRDGALYLQRGEMDIMIIERSAAGGKAKIVEREEIKTGIDDTPADAAAQLKEQDALLSAGAQGQTEIRLESRSKNITAEIDLASDASAIKKSRGPSNRKFDRSLEITAVDLENLIKALNSASPKGNGS